MKVIKRDGTVQSFDFNKILNAVRKAFDSVDEELTDKFSQELRDKLSCKDESDDCELQVEEIQDIIQNLLILRNKYKVVDSFIKYRAKRAEIRESKSELIREIQKKLQATDVQNQNANVDEKSFGGRMGEAAAVVSKNIALKSMSKTSRRNHENCEVYIHDLDNWAVGTHNCLTYPMDKSMREGVVTRQTDVRSAGSVNTAMQLVAVYFQLQSLNQFGGVSASHLDWTMVPYVRKSYMKHYIANWVKESPEFLQLDILSTTYEEFRHWIENRTTEFFLKENLSDKDFFFDNTALDGRLRQMALYDTKCEVYQAVEGLYHNLNVFGRHNSNVMNIAA